MDLRMRKETTLQKKPSLLTETQERAQACPREPTFFSSLCQTDAETQVS